MPTILPPEPVITVTFMAGYLFSPRQKVLNAERDGLRTLAADLALIEDLVRAAAGRTARWRGIAVLAVIERNKYRRHGLT